MSRISDPQPIERSRPSGDSDVIYIDYRRRDRVVVEKQPDQEQLAPERTLELANHSLGRFSWGYAGNGPAQLALALLLGCTDDGDVALEEYMELKAKVVNQLEHTEPDDCWRLTGHEIDTALREAVSKPVAPSIN